MSIRAKALVIVAAVLLTLSMLVLLVVMRSGLQDAVAADGEEAQARAGRLRATLAEQVGELHRRVTDYANWDDTYAYCRQPNPAFVAANLDPLTLQHQQFAELLLAKPDGQALVALGVDPRTGRATTPSDSVRRLLRDDPKLLAASLEANGTRAVRVVDGRPMLCAASPVLTSQRKGPAAGVLLVLWPLDALQLGRIAQLSGVASTPVDAASTSVPAAARQRLSSGLADPQPVLMTQHDTIVGLMALNDEQGRLATVLRYDTPRSAMLRHRASILELALIMALLTAVAAVCCLVLLDRMVLSRLARVRQFVASIDVDQPPVGQAPTDGRSDELSALAEAINSLLARESDQRARSARADGRLTALADSTRELLAGIDDNHLQRFVNCLGPASSADRVRLFLHETDADGVVHVRTCAEWCGPGIASQRDRTVNVSYSGPMARWLTVLPHGDRLHSRVAELPEVERQLLESHGVQALLVLPVLVGDEFAGVVGFDNCHSDDLFDPADEVFLESAVASLSQAIRHQRDTDALAESEARARLVADSVIDVIWTCDFEGRFTYASPSIYEMRGWRPEEIVGHHTLADALTPDGLAVAMEALAENLALIAAGQIPPVRTFDLQQPCRDGSLIWTESRVQALIRGGEAIGFIGVTRDVTERHEAQDEREQMTARLRQAAKMEAVGQLAGGVAHDFNNVLTTITGYCDLLRLTTPSNSPIVSDLNEIQRAVGRAAELTRQLLAFSRQDTGRARAIDLNNVVVGMERMLKRLVPANIQLALELDSQPCFVTADPGHIEQIIMNLVVNSGHATPAGGSITIQTSRADLHNTVFENELDPVSGPHVLLSVRDAGHGMDEATRQRVFEPFFTTKPTGTGTGLGLAVVFGLARQNGAHVSCDSAPGAGTVFSVYVPSTTAPVLDSAPSVEAEAIPGGSETILVVEDEVAVLTITERVLTNLGYTVVVANSGHQAMEILRDTSRTVDLLLTDMVMPEMSGAEVAAAARSERIGLPVLFVSGYAESVLAGMGATLGTTELLSKPFTAPELAEKVRLVLDTAQGRAGNRR
ncbi:MAG: response regulator [Armatimonadetes bacterium]|nr:response regulator [Armatimonadota bacterium]